MSGWVRRWRVDPAAVSRLAVRPDTGGLVLGVDPVGSPVHLPAPAGQARTVVCIGGLQLGRHLAFRALGAGARVAVASGRAGQWSTLQGRVGGRAALPVQPLGDFDLRGAGPARPVVAVLDAGARPARPGRLPAWTLLVVLLPFLDPDAVPLVTAADAVVAARTSPDEAAALGQALGLDRSTSSLVPGLPDDRVLLVGRRVVPVDVAPTWLEAEVLGPLTRLDG